MSSPSWSQEEVAATVADYLTMLEYELRGIPFNKTARRHDLLRSLDNRKNGAVEFKRANISAVLIELGYPYVDGYKPRGNYQELLKTELLAELERRPEIERTTAEIVDAAALAAVPPQDLNDVFVDPPIRERGELTYERLHREAWPQRVNYLEREARNASLGNAGELFVLELEHRRLWESGARELADKIEHTSATRGDGLGFDILSYEQDGRERPIEVKTTAFGSMTPFYASANEVEVSARRSGFQLYRVFKFRDKPQVFRLPGALRESCSLDPVQFRAQLR